MPGAGAPLDPDGLSISRPRQGRKKALPQTVPPTIRPEVPSGFSTDPVSDRRRSFRFPLVRKSLRPRLGGLEGEGLLTRDADAIRLTPLLGRLLVRVIAAVLDRYLPPDAFREGLPTHLSSRVG